MIGEGDLGFICQRLGGVFYAIMTSRYPIAALALSNANYSEYPDTIFRVDLRCVASGHGRIYMLLLDPVRI